jgi:hypothetical protein
VRRDVTFEEEVAYHKSNRSHTQTDSEEKEAPQELGSCSPHPPIAQRDPIVIDGPCEPIDPVDPIVPDDVLNATIVLGWKRPF